MKKLLSPEPQFFSLFAVFRMVIGLLILKHGLIVFDAKSMEQMAAFLDKSLSMPFPLFMAYLAKGTEFFAGAMLILGLFTRIAVFPLIVTMLVAIFGTHKGLIFGEAEPAFLFLLSFIAIYIAGSGKWSLDNWINQKK